MMEGSSEDYGVGIGITLGDVEEPLTVESLLSTRTSPGARLAALEEYVRMTRLTAYGQILDIRNGVLDPGRSARKTSSRFTGTSPPSTPCVSPLKIGALLGGRSNRTLRDLETFGTNIGIAFQLRDDVLGAGFDADESGKSSNDLVEGKRTLLVVKAWEKGSEADRYRLSRVLGNAQAAPEDVERARNVIRETRQPRLFRTADRRAHSDRAAVRRTQPNDPDPGQGAAEGSLGTVVRPESLGVGA